MDLVKPEDAAPAIQVQNLSYQYPGGQVALRGISFALGAGEKVALVGPSGAGKSTLLFHLNGLLPEKLPEQPMVQVQELPLQPGHLPEIRRRVGLVFQDPDDQLFCPTLGEDVAFGPLNLDLPLEEVRRRVRESLEQVGLTGYASRNTLELSTGEKKRGSIAGVLACQPDILALDEPFTNLDPRARRQLLNILRQFPGTLLMASHDLDLVVQLCTRVLVLNRGEVQADGETEEILSDAALMEQNGLEVPLRLKLRRTGWKED